jgi:hypothetical protein
MLRILFWNRCAIVACAQFIVYAGAVAHNDEVEMEMFGRVEQTEYKKDGSGTVWMKRTNDFCMAISRDKWLIRLVDLLPADAEVFRDYCEVSFDGELTYFLESYESIIAAKRAAGEKVGVNDAVGIVRRSGVPRFPFGWAAGPVWLTYASGRYFAKQTGGWAENPITHGGGDGHRNLTPDTFEIQKVEWLTLEPGALAPRQVKYFDGVFKDINTLFEVRAFLPLHDILIPERSDTRTFYRYGERALPAHDFTVITSNVVRGGSVRSFRPLVPGIVFVTEERFNGKEAASLHFTYLATNKWLSDAEVKALPVYRQVLRSRLGSIPVSKPDARTILIILVLLNVAFAVWLFWRTRRRKSDVPVNQI